MTEPGTETPVSADQPDQRGAEERRPAWRNPVVLVAALAVLVTVAIVLAIGPGDTEDAGIDDDGEAAAQEELVDEFSGSGDDTTASFTVEGRWEVRWETEGETFQVTLVDADGEELEPVVDHEGQGGGSNYLTQDGTYGLDVAADGDWSIRVFEHAE